MWVYRRPFFARCRISMNSMWQCGGCQSEFLSKTSFARCRITPRGWCFFSPTTPTAVVGVHNLSEPLIFLIYRIFMIATALTIGLAHDSYRVPFPCSTSRKHQTLPPPLLVFSPTTIEDERSHFLWSWIFSILHAHPVVGVFSHQPQPKTNVPIFYEFNFQYITSERYCPDLK